MNCYFCFAPLMGSSTYGQKVVIDEELLKNVIPTQKPEEPFEFFYKYAGIVIGTTKEIKDA